MRIVTSTEILNEEFKDSAITIGNFDGVHRGHFEIFRHLKERSSRLCIPSVVVTFEPHPLKLLAPAKAPEMITTFEQKCRMIASSGVDSLVVLSFTQELAMMSAEEFVQNILCDSLGMRHIVIGHDYAFGRGREGNFATLEKIGSERGFTLEDMNPVGGDTGVIFSSTLVRRMLSEGDTESAAGILGRYYAISGRVVHGRNIGKTLGFPTANISTENELIPPDGVYAVMVCIDGTLLKGACNIGSNPTFNGCARSIEVFLLDFSEQIYDREIEVYFVRRLRGEKKFPDASALQLAISSDIERSVAALDNLDQKLIAKTIGIK